MEDQEEISPSSIVARADALMQRQRSRLPQPEDVPLLTEVVDPNADLPVLVAEDFPLTLPEIEPVSRVAMEILARDLARRLSERLAQDIPGMVQTALRSALPDLARDLQAELARSTDAAIADFLAEREKLAKIQQQR